MEKIVVPVILGPTAVGKTDLALAAAERFGYEVISCDSRQIYRFMDVGTAKPTLEQRGRVHHWLIDILEPSQAYSAFAFASDALKIIRESAVRKKKVLICGGTGLYFYILSNGARALDEADAQVRTRLLEEAKVSGAPSLHERLKKVDPQTASRIHPNDLQRLLRALDIFSRSGQSVSALQKERLSPPQDIDFRTIVISRPREILYERINRRVDMMIGQGLREEFLSLRARGYTEMSPGMVCVGYREFFDVERGECGLTCASNLIKQNSRRYAKRQMTWLRNKTGAQHFIDLSDEDDSRLYRWFERLEF
ncbi:MAG: tRNA (adenosine(37)-N6)-dimethylallyltransferase MiaA [Chitinispirillales bacterium]|jgi:tRNA dimethylallyltransferase|nr:tRNA (adenosine(37)-N6)-dimethylallyltransferase MiaA [Chitinispirillales bacterium]